MEPRVLQIRVQARAALVYTIPSPYPTLVVPPAISPNLGIRQRIKTCPCARVRVHVRRLSCVVYSSTALKIELYDVFASLNGGCVTREPRDPTLTPSAAAYPARPLYGSRSCPI